MNLLQAPEALSELDDSAVRALAQTLIKRIADDAKCLASNTQELHLRQTKIDALTIEIRLLRHLRFGAKTEGMDSVQVKLFEEANAEDLGAAEQALSALTRAPADKPAKQHPVRKALPAHLSRTDIHHEPENTTCGCGQAMKRVSEDVSERLDYLPGTFSVERHIRGVWACPCKACARMRQEPMPAQIIDSGIPTANLLAHVIIAKHDDHLPLYRQSEIFARSGVDIPRSTLADWVGAAGVALAPIARALKAQLLQSAVLHGDESPITILDKKGQKHRGYIWAYASGVHDPHKAVVYEIRNSRSGQHARDFLCHEPDKRPDKRPDKPPLIEGDSTQKSWSGHLVVDGYSGYKALFAALEGAPIMEVGCWAHVRRKFFELHVASKSTLAAQALASIGQLYNIERGIREAALQVNAITQVRQAQSKPLLQALHAWLVAQRHSITDGTATAKAMDYALKRWDALIRYADDGRLPIDNNRIENKIRPWALGRKNWLFAGSFAAADRAADIMTLIESAKMNDIEPMAYLSDVLTRLPTHPNSRIAELLPTQWQPNPVPAAK